MSEFWDVTESISKIEPLKPSRIQWLEDHFTPRIQCHLAIYFARYVLGNLLTRQLEGVNELLDNLEALLEDKIDRLPTLSETFVTSHFIGSTPHRVFHPNLNAIYAVHDYKNNLNLNAIYAAHDYKNKNLHLNLLNMEEVVRFDTTNACPVPIDNWKAVHHLMNILEFMVLFEVNSEKRLATIQQINELLKLFCKPADWNLNWHTGTTTQLAKTIYDTKDWSSCPILGDALMDAGCSNDRIIEICRQEKLLDRNMYFLRVLAGKDQL